MPVQSYRHHILTLFSQQIWGGMRPFHPLDSEMSLVYVLVVLLYTSEYA
jgi:hypothetical protein